jgi:ABC-2 type transport system permease protein
MALNLFQQFPNFEYVLSNISFIFIIIIPVLTMRAIADERKQKTDQLLYSLPLSLTQIVMGKFFALLAVLLVPVAIMGIYPLILSMFGQVLMGAAYGTLLAFFLLGATLIAMGLFISSLTDNQAMAAVVCFIIMLLNFYLKSLSSNVPGTANASLFRLAIVILLLGFAVKSLT